MRLGDMAAAAVIVAVTAGAPPAAAEPVCSMAARVSGEPALVDAVVSMLRERGVDVARPNRPAACPTVIAVLIRADEHVRVAIVDGEGRTVDRLADDVLGAVTIIESWTRRDLTEPLLAAQLPSPLPSQALDRESPPATDIAPPSAAGQRRDIQVFGAAEAMASVDGAMWAGVRVQGCVDIGAVCVGVLARYARDTERLGDSADLNTRRTAKDMMLIADVPLRRGRWALAGGGGLGLATVESEARAFTMEAEAFSFALATRAHVAAAYALADAWSLRFDLGVGYALFDGFDYEDNVAVRGGPPVAGAPRGRLSLGLGFAYGGL